MKLKQNKNKIIIAAVILAALAGAWFYGGNYNKSGGEEQPVTAAQGSKQTPPKTTDRDAEQTPPAGPLGSDEMPLISTENTAGPSSITGGDEAPTPAESDETVFETSGQEANETSPSATTSDLPGTQDTSEAGGIPAPPPAGQAAGDNTETSGQGYLTDPAPEDKPPPVEPETANIGDDSFTVTITVRCDTILGNMNLLNEDKWELVPEDGVIFPITTVTAYDGESVFNVFSREMKRAKIHLAFRNTPVYNSAFIEAVNNLYEFDAGELSGWMYSVNGWYPNYGCARYQLSPGDVIEWRYTCDLGRDLGQPQTAQWQY